jgi:S1-C subfamily serine protease
MNTSRSFVAGAIGGIVGAALLILVLVLLGVTDVKKETTVTVTTPAPVAVASPAAPAAAPSPDAASPGATLTPTQIYDKEATGVVEITSTFPTAGSDVFGQSLGGNVAVGSGFVVSNKGYILTNAHVVFDSGHRATKLTVMFKGTGSQTRTVSGTIVGVDTLSDVAVIKVATEGLTLNPLPMGDSGSVQVGESVVAIGNPLQLEFTLTSGIVSAIHRDLSPQSGTNIFDGIQTDAAINPGNSGGPLIDAAGDVIGINESIESTTGGNQGLGFAVPIDTAKNSLDQIVKTGHVAYPWMGVTLQTLTPDLAKAFKYKVTEGALVSAVKAGGPAAKAGIKGGTSTVTVQGQSFTIGGVVITAVNGKAVTSASDLVQAVDTYKPGDTITLTTVDKQGASASVKVKLATRPANL